MQINMTATYSDKMHAERTHCEFLSPQPKHYSEQTVEID